MLARVHPRSRRKHCRITAGTAADAGPPPLAREAPTRHHREDHHERSTPARAGSTRADTASGAPGTVHPRSRGKHPVVALRALAVDGPPPLAREARSHRGRARGGGRSTPARAGSTPRSPGPGGTTAVHPRSRGKHRSASAAMSLWCGPPPLAREARHVAETALRAGRSTPARAGSTRGGAASRTTSTVHPRSRGKHADGVSDGGGPRGPPPLAREAREHRDRQPPLAREARWWRSSRRCSSRSTPARAGSTPSRARSASHSAVHPRSRGKHYGSLRTSPTRSGPPPLAREARARARRGGRGLRSTPARAGSTSSATSRIARRAVHPRSRGKHPTLDPDTGEYDGPPPLAREAQNRRRFRRPGKWSTPARAGSTLSDLCVQRGFAVS